MPQNGLRKIDEKELAPGVSTESALRTTTDTSAATPELGTSKGRKKWALMGVILAIIAVLGGGSAAAYYTLVIPNKPENILKKAITSMLTQKKTAFEGKISYESADQANKVKAVNVTFNGSSNADINAFSSVFNITASGVNVPVELRHIDKNIYLKVGDLGGLKGLVHSAYPAYAPTFDALNAKLANQWVEVDETLLKQAGADCTLDANLSLTPADITLLEKRYSQVAFMSVKTTNNDSVNGHSATKYEIEIDDNKSAEYFKGLQDISVIKKIKECTTKNGTQFSDMTPAANNDITPLTIWVDKNTKQIIKLASNITSKNDAKSKAKTSFEVTMRYGQAEIAKPEAVKPLLEVLGDFSQSFGLGAGMTTPAINKPSAQQTPPPPGGVTQECLQAIQDYTNSGGTKPIPSCL